MKINIKKGSATNSDTTISNNSFKISLLFTNEGTRQESILNIFEPLPVFFSFDMVSKMGIPVELPGAGKISFGRTQIFQYLIINPGDAYIMTIDILPYLKTYEIALEKGIYKLQVTYHNQYGENCLKGNFVSNKIEFKIE